MPDTGLGVSHLGGPLRRRRLAHEVMLRRQRHLVLGLVLVACQRHVPVNWGVEWKGRRWGRGRGRSIPGTPSESPSSSTLPAEVVLLRLAILDGEYLLVRIQVRSCSAVMRKVATLGYL